MLVLEVYGGGYAEVGCRVASADPGVVVYKWGVGWGVAFPAPAYDQGLEQGLAVWGGVEEAGAFGGAKPLMAVACVEVGPGGVYRKVDLAGSVGAVVECDYAGCAAAAAYLGD